MTSTTHADIMSKMRAIVVLLFFLTAVVRAETVKMSMVGNLYSIPVVINQTTSAPMVVDTGASEHILTDWFAKRTKLKIRETDEQDADSGGSSFKIFRGKIKSMRAEKHVQANFNIAVVSFPSFPEEEGIVGLFSPQTFYSGESFLIDHPHLLVKSGADASTKKRVVLEKIPLFPCSKVENTLYMIAAKMNGVPGKLLLDTGGFKSTIKETFAAKLGKLDTVPASRSGIAGKRSVKRVRGLELTVGRLMYAITADVENNSSGCTGSDGKLGIEWLSHFGLLFDRDRRQMSLLR